MAARRYALWPPGRKGAGRARSHGVVGIPSFCPVDEHQHCLPSGRTPALFARRRGLRVGCVAAPSWRSASAAPPKAALVGQTGSPSIGKRAEASLFDSSVGRCPAATWSRPAPTMCLQTVHGSTGPRPNSKPLEPRCRLRFQDPPEIRRGLGRAHGGMEARCCGQPRGREGWLAQQRVKLRSHQVEIGPKHR